MPKEIIGFQTVNYSFEKNSHFVFKNINLSIQENTITSIIGKNGSGKTTLLLLILGYLTPASGVIRINDVKKQKKPTDRLNKSITFLPQIESVPVRFTVDDFMMLGRVPFVSSFQQPTLADFEIIQNVKYLLKIEELGNKRLGEISGGELQQVRIGRTLVQEADILLFDEPITHLDIESKYKIMRILKFLKKSGKTVIFTTHDPLESFMIADYSILISKDQKVEFGLVEQILTEEILSTCMGIPIEIGSYNGRTIILPESDL